MIEFEKPNIKCLEMDNDKNYAKFVFFLKIREYFNYCFYKKRRSNLTFQNFYILFQTII